MKKLNLELTNVDELFKFSTNNGKVENIVMLNPNEISDFPNHPFKIEDNEEMERMVESVKQIGVKIPVLVRPKQDGGYEMVSGHRRNYAVKKAGLIEIPAIIREMTDEEAIIVMVDSNIQREKVLPSEKAFAYKMKLDAIKSQGKRNDITSCQVGTKLRSDQKVSEKSEDSARQIQRYIRLTELIKELLGMVDEGKIAFNPAVELSYLTEEQQNLLLEFIKMYEITPSQSQAIYLKKLSQEGNFTIDKMEEIMSKEKPNQKEQIKFSVEKVREYFPPNYTAEKMQNVITKLLENYRNRWKNKSKENER